MTPERKRTLHRGCQPSWSAEGEDPPVVLLHGMGIGAAGWRPQVDALGSRAALAAELAVLFGHDLAEQPPVVMDQLRATKRASAEALLPALASLPTLVVSASDDIIAPPAAGRALAAGIPGARYVEIADAAHGVTIQRADEVNTLLFDHLDRAAV